jgi:hypothetical protein
VRIIQGFDSNGENGSLKVRRDSPFLDRARGLELAWHRPQRTRLAGSQSIPDCVFIGTRRG